MEQSEAQVEVLWRRGFLKNVKPPGAELCSEGQLAEGTGTLCGLIYPVHYGTRTGFMIDTR